MINIKPKGLSFNKNALNINIRTPSPPKLKPIPAQDEKAKENRSRIPRPSTKLLQLKDQLKEKLKEEVTQRESDTETIEDIDKLATRDAIFQVAEIAKDIYDYMFKLEDQQSIRQDHLKDQKVFNPRVRQRLVNWCIETITQLDLLPETLYMTIAVIDRYFNKIAVSQQNQVQLVAAGAILIASKYEEIYPPNLDDVLYLMKNAYSRRDILHIEREILKQLDYDLGRPVPLAFLRRFSKAAHCDLKMHSLAKFLMEISLPEYEFSHWRPSMLAATALYVAINLLHPHQDRWTKTLAHYTNYNKAQLRAPAALLSLALKRVLKNPTSLKCTKNNQSLTRWPELRSTRVEELIKSAN